MSHNEGSQRFRSSCTAAPSSKTGILSYVPEEIQKLLTVEDNLMEGDPGLVAPEKGDFRLRDDSPALNLGFKPIPFDKIGLYQDAYR